MHLKKIIILSIIITSGVFSHIAIAGDEEEQQRSASDLGFTDFQIQEGGDFTKLDQYNSFVAHIKKLADILFMFFSNKTHAEKIEYLRKYTLYWIPKIKQEFEKYAKQYEFEDPQTLITKLNTQVLAQIQLLNVILSKSRDNYVIEKAGGIFLIINAQSYGARLYFLDHTFSFDLRSPDFFKNKKIGRMRLYTMDFFLSNYFYHNDRVTAIVDVALKNNNRNLNKNLMQLFNSLPDKTSWLYFVLEQLSKALNSDNYMVRHNAVLSFRNVLLDYEVMYNPDEAPETESRNIHDTFPQIIIMVHQLIKMLSEDKSTYVRQQIIQTLSRIVNISFLNKVTKIYIDDVTEALFKVSRIESEKNVKLRVLAVQALGRLEVFPFQYLVNVMENDIPRVQMQALQILATKFPFNNRVQELVIDALDNSMIQHQAVRSAGVILSSSLVEDRVKDQLLTKLREVQKIYLSQKLKKVEKSVSSNKDTAINKEINNVLFNQEIDSIINNFTMGNSDSCRRGFL